MRNCVVLCCVICLIGCSEKANRNDQTAASSTSGSTYVGTVHGEMPAGIERKGWTFLDSIGGHDYAVTAVKEGRRAMFWLDESISTDSTREWKVVSELAFDSLTNGQELTIGSCSGLDLPPARLVAVVRRDAPGAAAAVESAWHVNRLGHRFDPVRASAVVCH